MRVEQESETKIKEASSLALMTDGWTNVTGDGLINFIVTTPKPVFLKSINRKTNRETGEYVANEIKNVIKEIGSEKFLLFVLLTAANMKAAWGIVTKNHPHISAVGCSWVAEFVERSNEA